QGSGPRPVEERGRKRSLKRQGNRRDPERPRHPNRPPHRSQIPDRAEHSAEQHAAEILSGRKREPMNASMRAAVIAEWRGLPANKTKPDRWQAPADLLP